MGKGTCDHDGTWKPPIDFTNCLPRKLHPHLPLPSLPQSLLKSLPQSLPHRSLLQNLHLPPAPSVTIKRLAFKLPMALIAPLIQFALTKSATRMKNGQIRGGAASAATKQAMGTLVMSAVMRVSSIERICAGAD